MPKEAILMEQFMVMERENQILGKFFTQEAAEAARLEYCKITAGDRPLVFVECMERTLVVKYPEEKEIGRIA